MQKQKRKKRNREYIKKVLKNKTKIKNKTICFIILHIKYIDKKNQ